jgi:hypothetical protein
MGGLNLGILIERVKVEPGYRLQDYAEYNYLAPQVAELEAAARMAVPHLVGRTIWIVSSTSRGGGVAEGLPRIVSLAPPFEAPALRLQVDGSFRPAVFPEDVGLLSARS